MEGRKTNYTQKEVSEGLERMPFDTHFPVPTGSLEFIQNYMDAFPYSGGIQLNHDKTEFYKIRLPEIK